MFVQVNEAFAAQYVAVEKELGLDRAKTNTNGGAIGKTVSSLRPTQMGHLCCTRHWGSFFIGQSLLNGGHE